VKYVFEGIRVLDFGRFVSAPFAALLMSNMGAEVIKVEKANGGDDSRYLGPWCNGVTTYYPSYNYNKKSMAINFRHKEGQKILLDLVGKSDVIIENFRPGTINQMGISYEVCQKINPGIIILSISGFGQDGPYKDRAAFNDVIESVGMMAYMLPNGKPVATHGGPIADVFTGVYGVSAIAAALYNRNKTGKGQYIDMSMINGATAMRSADIAAAECNIEKEREEAPTGVCRAQDNTYFSFWAGDDETFEKLRKTIRSPVLDNMKFNDMKARIEDEKEILAEIEKFAASQSAPEVAKLLNSAGVPSAAVSIENNGLDLARNEHLNEAGWLVPIEVEGLGVLKHHAFPFRMSACPEPVYGPAVKLGYNNDDILVNLLGRTQTEVETLRETGAIL